MLKSNCKKALENIRDYILNNTDAEPYGVDQPKDYKEASKFVLDCFYNEYMCGYRANMNRQQCFTDWLAGLPTIFDAGFFYNRSAIDDLGALLEETEEEKSRFTEAQAQKTLSALLYREISKAAGRYW